MGLFSRIFGSGNDLEQRLEEQYTALAQAGMGMSPQEARDYAKMLLQEAKSKSRETPDGLGDSLLAQEKTEPEVRDKFAPRRAEGVTDTDIRWWWNLPDLERQVMVASDNTHRMALFISCLQKGMTKEESAKAVRKAFPMYGDTADTTHGEGDDRPLPYELKDRVNRYVERYLMPDPSGAKVKMAMYQTYNAFIRAEIRAGKV